MSNGGNQSENVKLEEHFITRRAFARTLFTGVGLCYAGAIGYPIYRYLASPIERANETAAVNEVSLPDADKLEKGAVMMFRFGTRPSLLIHHADDTWSALDAVCTHLGCTVQYQPEAKKIVCACHGGVYDAHTGDALSGPPPKGLKSFKVVPGNGSVVISKT
jgi:cytochrome b6-f complex iron-sulfur subunit